MQISHEEIQAMLTKAAAAGIREYNRQLDKDHKRSKYHDTYMLMKSYSDAVYHMEHAISEGNQLELPDITPEEQDTYLRSIRRTRFRTMLMLSHIDKALDEVKRRRTAAGREVEYEAFELYFVQRETYEQIAEELSTGKNTPRRWVTGILNELNVLLWGIDDNQYAG